MRRSGCCATFVHAAVRVQWKSYRKLSLRTLMQANGSSPRLFCRYAGIQNSQLALAQIENFNGREVEGVVKAKVVLWRSVGRPGTEQTR